ncbi:hypothetical protein [Streptomyces sp.]|jgi:hypothetical protein
MTMSQVAPAAVAPTAAALLALSAQRADQLVPGHAAADPGVLVGNQPGGELVFRVQRSQFRSLS